MEQTATKALRDYVRIYRHAGLAELAADLEHVTDWRPHTWYNAATRESHSNPDNELEVTTPVQGGRLAVATSSVATDSVKEYCRELMPIGAVTHLSNPRLNRYQAGACMRPHVDHIHSLFDGQAKGVPVLTVLGGLNPSQDYTGGAFILCGVPLQLEAGDVAVFPSSFLYPHEVAEVLSGVRYSFVCWAW